MPDRKKRYHFLDLLKAYAVLMMIQGHTLDAVLNATDKLTELYRFLHILRGLTAPAFLMAAGFGVVFSTGQKKDLPAGRLLGRRVIRVLPILIIGYFLHLPYFSAVKITTGLTGAEWQKFLQCDILQTIGFTVIGLQIIIAMAADRKLRALLSTAAVAFTLILTPAAHARDTLPLPLVQLISPSHGSPFPLFPFAAYLFAGAALGHLFIWLQERSGPALTRTYLWVLGAAMFAVSFAAPSDHWRLFLFRTGILTVLCGIFLLFEGYRGPEQKFFVTLGQESLVIYYVHIMIVYGSVINRGLTHFLGTELNTLQSSAAAAALTALMILFGLEWSYLKAGDRELSRMLRNALAASALLVFLSNL